MKKIFTLLAAMLMTISMMAKDVTFTCDDTWSQDGATLTNTKEGVTVTVSWSSRVDQETVVTYFDFTTGTRSGTVNVSVASQSETITNLKIEDASVLYNGTDISHTFDLAAGSNMCISKITVTLADASTELVATPSVTTFSTLDDLKGMTITLTGTVPQYRSEMDCSYIFITDAENTAVYALADFENYSVSNNVITINQFVTMPGETAPLPAEGTNLVFQLIDFFAGSDYGTVTTTSVSYTPASTGLVATPSVTEFSTLDDLNGMTITLTGDVPQYAGSKGGIFLADPDVHNPVIYAVALPDDLTCNPGEISIEKFQTMPGATALPTAECDMALMLVDVFEGQEDVIPVSIHYTPTSTTALLNISANAKAAKTTKFVENGKIIILRDGKKFNVVGQRM